MASSRALPLLSAALLVPLLVHAAEQTRTGEIQVSVTIVGECTVFTPQPLNFGVNVSAGFAQPVNAEAQLEVTCASNTPYTITLNGGLNGSTITDRKMTSGAAELPYGLFTDAARTNAWGDGTTGTSVSGTGNGNSQSITVYGQLPVPDSSPAPGVYQDTVTATLTY